MRAVLGAIIEGIIVIGNLCYVAAVGYLSWAGLCIVWKMVTP